MNHQIIKHTCMSAAILLLGSQAMAATWTTSADLRERYQSFDNFNFNSAVDNDAWEFDSRLYVKARGEFGNGLSLFLQPQAVSIQNHTTANGTRNFSQATCCKFTCNTISATSASYWVVSSSPMEINDCLGIWAGRMWHVHLTA